MKKLWWPVLLLTLACSRLLPPQVDPTPNEFPPPPPTTDLGTPPPMTVIVEWPQFTPTTTLEPRPRPVLPEDMDEAETFFLIIKTMLTAGDDLGVAERVKYPLEVTLASEPITLHNPEEFLSHFGELFDQDFVTELIELEETDLSLQPEGVRVGEGELWFDYFCIDLSCSDAQFMITQINP